MESETVINQSVPAAFVQQAVLTQVLYQEMLKVAYAANNKTVAAPQAELLHSVALAAAQLSGVPNTEENSATIKRTLHMLRTLTTTYEAVLSYNPNQQELQ